MSAKTDPICLFAGHTIHQRFVPFGHRFSYRLDLVDIDLDALAEANQTSTLFSIDRSNLFSFRRTDHGDRSGTGLRAWAEEKLASAGVFLDGGAIRLLTFPRHAFYKFAPISVWRGYGPDGLLRGAIYEVNNTFGDSHSYVAAIDPDQSRHRHASEKRFHVSPFFDVTGTYKFTLREDAQNFSLLVESRDPTDAKAHLATLKGRKVPMNSGALMRIATTKPLSSLSVSLAIHWQAVILWLKGAKYHRRPKPPERAISIAKTEAG
ncbi:MAG: DUF1365 domain-containing protein [Pseudomonadota bacterium]